MCLNFIQELVLAFIHFYPLSIFFLGYWFYCVAVFPTNYYASLFNSFSYVAAFFCIPLLIFCNPSAR
jgi:hypothetical protein